MRLCFFQQGLHFTCISISSHASFTKPPPHKFLHTNFLCTHFIHIATSAPPPHTTIYAYASSTHASSIYPLPHNFICTHFFRTTCSAHTSLPYRYDFTCIEGIKSKPLVNFPSFERFHRLVNSILDTIKVNQHHLQWHSISLIASMDNWVCHFIT